MLSRVAESIYWMSRYIERAENIVRVVSVNTNLQLDLPRGVVPGWKPLVDCIGANDLFEACHESYGERQVLRYLLGNRDSPSSVRRCLHDARECCRTVRDILPRETWEHLTELRLFIEEDLESGLTRRGRHAFLERIIRSCQMTMGLLGSVMTRDLGYQFLRLGRNLERADMTTRFINLRLSVDASVGQPELASLESVQWVKVLESLSAYHMYRRKLKTQVERQHALWFLFNDDEFPRSFRHCVNALEECVGPLSENRPCLLAIRKLVDEMDQVRVEALAPSDLDQLVDALQRHLMSVHATVARMYFLPSPTD